MATWRSWAVLAGFVVGCLAVGGLGGFVTAPAIPGWYAQLRKPSFNPPSWLFGPVWTLLYVTMGVAAWLIWRRAGGFVGAREPLILFAVQLFLNGIWTPLFFGLHWIGIALLDIVLLWGAILATLILFWRVTPLAGALLIPYLAWVSFASILNFAIWRLNR